MTTPLLIIATAIQATDAIEKASRSSAAETREARRAAEKAALQAAVAELCDAHPELEAPTAERGALVTAARNIRRQLAARWPHVKFSVRSSRFSGGDSINISWIDGPTQAMVAEIADRYRAGFFDGYSDSYEYTTSPWTEAFGDAKYISTRRDYSDAAVAWAKATYGDKPRDISGREAYWIALGSLSIKRLK